MSRNAVLSISRQALNSEGRTFSSWRPTILVAEDSADSREMMQVLLETKGYQVVAADDGVRALEEAIRTRPDLLLLDLELPKLDGLSVTRNLRSRPNFKDVPIIIVSGHDPSRFRQEALEAGCNDYLLKPINFDRLHELLDRVIAGRPRSFVKSA